jgi:heat shock protein HslJ
VNASSSLVLALFVSLLPLLAMAADQPNVQAPAQVPPAAAPPSRLPAGPWQWQSTQHPDGTGTVAADPTRYTLAFRPDGTLAIRADCNSVTGAYTVNGAELSLRLGASTLVGCPPDSQADQFQAALSQVTSYTLVDGDLRLDLGPAGGRMLLVPLPVPELAGPTWRLNAYNNGRGGVQSLLAGTQITAVFGTDGRVGGSAGCNTYVGPYEISGDSLTIGPPATTRRACAQPVMDQEAAYLAALQATTRYRFEDGRLVLRDAADATQAIFVLNPE